MVVYREEMGHTHERDIRAEARKKTSSEGSGEGSLNSEMLKITAGLGVKYLIPTGTQRAGTDKNAVASKPK